MTLTLGKKQWRFPLKGMLIKLFLHFAKEMKYSSSDAGVTLQVAFSCILHTPMTCSSSRTNVAWFPPGSLAWGFQLIVPPKLCTRPWPGRATGYSVSCLSTAPFYNQDAEGSKEPSNPLKDWSRQGAVWPIGTCLSPAYFSSLPTESLWQRSTWRGPHRLSGWVSSCHSKTFTEWALSSCTILIYRNSL